MIVLSASFLSFSSKKVVFLELIEAQATIDFNASLATSAMAQPINSTVSLSETSSISPPSTAGPGSYGAADAAAASGTASLVMHGDGVDPIPGVVDASPVQRRKMTWKHFAFFAFVFTSAGPFGMESAVHDAGPLLTFFLIFLVPVFHVTPIVFMVTELSSWMPTNHGSVLWIDRAFGHFVGFTSAIMQLMINLLDISIYPVLATDYLQRQFFPDVSFGMRYVVSVVFIIVGSIPAFLGMEDMGSVAAIMMGLIIAPFVLGIGKGIPTITTSNWGDVNSNVDIGGMLSVGIWMYTGFLALGALGGEVENHKVFIKGSLMALFIDTAMYILPLIVALQVPGDWKDGFLVTAFDTIWPGLGVGVSLAGAMSGFGLFCSSLACFGRTIWGVADKGWLPKKLTTVSKKTGCPYYTIIIQVVCACALCGFDFNFLVTMELVIGTANFCLFFLSFVTLRYKEPFGDRKYTVPGGKLVAWAIITPIFCIFVTLFVTSLAADWRVDVGVFMMVISVAGIYIGFVRGQQPPKSEPSAADVAATSAPASADPESNAQVKTSE